MELLPEENIIDIVSINGTSLYGIYSGDDTVDKLTRTLFDNYENKGVSQDKIRLYSEELKRFFDKEDLQKSLKEFKLSKLSKITLMSSQEDEIIEDKRTKIEQLEYARKLIDDIEKDKNNSTIFVKLFDGTTQVCTKRLK
jgi:hypothetical protein